MIIRLIIRKQPNGGVAMQTDFKAESRDTPRINNFGIHIKEKLDEAIAEAEAKGKAAF